MKIELKFNYGKWVKMVRKCMKWQAVVSGTVQTLGVPY